MDPQWKIKTDVETAKAKIVADRISVNWVVIGTPLDQDLHDDYILDTTDLHKRTLDEFFRSMFANGTILIPEVFDPKENNTVDTPPANPPSVGGDQTTVLQTTTLQTCDENDKHTPNNKDDSVSDNRRMYKIFVLVLDERQLPEIKRGVTLFVYGVRQDGNHYVVKTLELLQELQDSPDPIVGSARLAVNVTHAGFSFCTTFITIHEEADRIGLPANPEIHLNPTDAADTTGCDFSLVIFVETLEKAHPAPAQGKRHFSALSTDNEEETKHLAQREGTQLAWLEGPSGYDNSIAEAIWQNVSTRQAQPSCAVAIFAAYIHIVSHITPGDNCLPAGRANITNRLLASFLKCQPDWITAAKAAGSLQITARELLTVRAHMDGEMEHTYMGMKTWRDFLVGAIEANKVKAEATEQ
ncbi:hypothetical protein C8F04DRAFT_1260258 [Mycena alexandri]|uniref:Uncharacterized protein n=1 Tax=Mycena alexandri TaxID=1745969 RepID=A0AAD6SV48_9AGAR|nr:hypothetical protein C8F04DRAFT_1260258 [Mycena alexandri]